jgi:hypothetical protein
VLRAKTGLAAGAVLMIVLGVLAAGASAHPFHGWTGKSGPFRWQAELISCGAATGEPNRIHAHSRWVTSPDNGYQKATFRRQIRDDAVWRTVATRTHTTRNTLEGLRGVLHWTQVFLPRDNQAGKTSRDIVLFAWKRDRNGPDSTVLTRRVSLKSCVVGS